MHNSYAACLEQTQLSHDKSRWFYKKFVLEMSKAQNII